MDIEIATDILTESHTHLVEGKSGGLTHKLIHEATQTGKCWDEIKGILRLKLCNVNIHIYTSCFMEIKQKGNETLAAHIHCFKTATKQCAVDNDTAAICIFVKGLWEAHTTAVKIYKKDPQTLAEVIRFVEKLNAAQQLTVLLTPSTVSMMSNNNRCFVCGQTGNFGCCCPDVQCYGCDKFSHFAQDCPSKIHPPGTPVYQDRSHSEQILSII